MRYGYRRGHVLLEREGWGMAMDFVHDQLATGKKLRVLTVIDTFSRYVPVLDPCHISIPTPAMPCRVAIPNSAKCPGRHSPALCAATRGCILFDVRVPPSLRRQDYELRPRRSSADSFKTTAAQRPPQVSRTPWPNLRAMSVSRRGNSRMFVRRSPLGNDQCITP